MALAVDAGQMLVNFSQSYEPIFKMLTGGAYVAGVAFGFLAIYTLKEYGEQRSMMSSSTSLKPALVYLMVAAVFLYLPSAIDVLMQSTFGASSIPIASGAQGNELVGVDVQMAILRMVQIVGLVAFIRG